MKPALHALLASFAVSACDSPNVTPTNGCVNESPAVDGQFCNHAGSRCPLEPQPGTVCATEAGASLAANATCTCGDAGKWACDEDAAIACSEPECSFGAPCNAGSTCESQTRGTTLFCDSTGHLVQCSAGQTMRMGCDVCTCQDGAWACSTGSCDAAAD